MNVFCPILFQNSYLAFYATFYPVQRLEIIVINNFIKRLGNKLHYYYYYETQHLPIYIHLQAMACKRGSLKYEIGLSNELYFKMKISLAQT